MVAVIAAFFWGMKRGSKYRLPEWEENIRLAFQGLKNREEKSDEAIVVLEETVISEVKKEVDRLRK